MSCMCHVKRRVSHQSTAVDVAVRPARVAAASGDVSRYRVRGAGNARPPQGLWQNS